MAMATVLSRAQAGMEAPLVRVEVDLSPGLPRFSIVGLAEAVVKESRDRVRAAIANCKFTMPEGRVTVNLSPADLPKDGGRYDLPIALGILRASEQLPAEPLQDCEFYGELSLSGEVQAMQGALLVAVAAARVKHSIFVPRANVSEAALVTGCRIAIATTLPAVAAHATGQSPCEFIIGAAPSAVASVSADLSEVRGQEGAKRALEIAAAGAHSLLFIGPPGTGKSMLAQRLPSLLPLMSESEALEVAAVRSVAGMPINTPLWRVRPFRAPHHSASSVALVGGGSSPRPGEISLAHHGVLFLDELPEYERTALEVLREPLETGVITISRAARQAEFPASFQFVAAMNPCPCGYLGDIRGACHCTAEQVRRYRQRLSGPLIDRLDLHVEVLRVPHETLRMAKTDAETSATVATRVARVREAQIARQGCANARLLTREIERLCKPTARAGDLLDQAANKFGFSARAYHRILKVARTIADLADAERIDLAQVSEALMLRKLDRS
ncbi:MAG: YifB family Mg chelatase-like AAA ATPase [Pseudomonadota bacterium]|nr:YifB family Mg chelatase-like AAA ATPase [Pseudomonadota bacterium]